MKTLKILLCSLALVITFGCSTPEMAAYKTTATIEKSVDTAMGIYIDYKQTHPVPVDVQLKVRKYAQMWVDANDAATVAVLAYDAALKSSGDPASPEVIAADAKKMAAISAVSAASAYLLDLVNSIIGK